MDEGCCLGLQAVTARMTSGMGRVLLLGHFDRASVVLAVVIYNEDGCARGSATKRRPQPVCAACHKVSGSSQLFDDSPKGLQEAEAAGRPARDDRLREAQPRAAGGRIVMTSEWSSAPSHEGNGGSCYLQKCLSFWQALSLSRWCVVVPCPSSYFTNNQLPLLLLPLKAVCCCSISSSCDYIRFSLSPPPRPPPQQSRPPDQPPSSSHLQRLRVVFLEIDSPHTHVTLAEPILDRRVGRGCPLSLAC